MGNPGRTLLNLPVLACALLWATPTVDATEPQIVSVRKIWDAGQHNAFTDLIRFRDRWWCTFREADGHGGSIGKVRVIVSIDGNQWESAALLELQEVDLRDPKLSLMPDGRLMLIMGGSVYEDAKYQTRAPRVSFSTDGVDWSAPRKLLAEDHWLWRVTWHGAYAWSVSKLGEGRDPRRAMLYRSRDGLDWQWITEFRLPHETWNASETTLRFMPDGELIALTRPHWIGTSRPPYRQWAWAKIEHNVGGPNFIRTPDGSLWAAGRQYGAKKTTVLARMTRSTYEPVLTLPSGGDCSYPGLVWHDGLLWMSYYSSHEEKTSIYLATIRLPDAGLDATAAQRVHPVLIRKDHNPLMQLKLSTDQPGASVKSFAFTLRGTDDLRDLESLQMFATGDKIEFSTDNAISEPVEPAESLIFRVDWSLPPGEHVFWLSCRLRPGASLTHRVDAICTAIETPAGTVTPRDDTPGVRKRIGVALRQHNDDGVHTYRIPALATTPNGTLLCVYDMRRRMSRDLQQDIDIGLSRSTDGGRAWEPVRVIMDMGEYGGLPQEQNGCSDPGIIVDRQTGDIFCFAVWMHGKPGKHQWTGDGSEPGYEIGKSAQFLMVRSQDDGRTWSKPGNLTRKLKKEAWWLFAPSPQQGIQLADGTLVMPSQGRDEQGKEFSTIMISRDHGASWTVGTPAYSGGSECQAVQLGDGSIMLNMRNEHERFRAVAVTRDLGRTWQPHETSRNTLIEPNCNGSFLRVDYEQAGEKKNVLLFANPHTQQGRTHHTIQVSFDDGRTWPKSHHLLLDEGRGAGYPSLTHVDDQHVGIVYEGSQSHVVFEKFKLDKLLHPASAETAISVHNPRHLPADLIECERIPLGEVDDYKPCIARLPDGKLLLTAFHQYQRDGNKVMEQTLLFRSQDGGRTWSPPEKLDLLGREPYLTVLPDGTIFLTGHLLAQDVRNQWDYTCGFLHRSTDRGKTWESIRIESEGIKPGASNHSSRNVLRLADGTLLLGVDYDGGNGPYFMWRSTDGGKTWDKTRQCHPRDFQSQYGFFGGETWLWQARSGKIWALVRVDSNEMPIKDRPITAKNDQADHFILFSSGDGGRTFDRIRDFGDYGEMYMSLLRLHDRRLLLTFTVRDLNPPLGVRALFGLATDDGFEFDFGHDRLMLDTGTPIEKYQGGGFGPTVQLEDGTLVTSYSYRGEGDKTHLEVVRWKPPAQRNLARPGKAGGPVRVGGHRDAVRQPVDCRTALRARRHEEPQERNVTCSTFSAGNRHGSVTGIHVGTF